MDTCSKLIYTYLASLFQEITPENGKGAQTQFGRPKEPCMTVPPSAAVPVQLAYHVMDSRRVPPTHESLALALANI